MSGNAKNNQKFLRELTETAVGKLQKEQFAVSELVLETNPGCSNPQSEAPGLNHFFSCNVIRKKQINPKADVPGKQIDAGSEGFWEAGSGGMNFYISKFKKYRNHPPKVSGYGK